MSKQPTPEWARELRKLINRGLEYQRKGLAKDPFLNGPALVWKILAAARGPDNGNEALKDVTTARIRAVAFPSIALEAGAIVSTGAIPDSVDLSSQKAFFNVGSVEHHFAVHLDQAKDALYRLGYLTGDPLEEVTE